MKKILDNNWFAIILIAVQVICLIIGIRVAVNDGCHTWIAFLVFTLTGLFLLSTILTVCALVVKSTRLWLYITLTVIWLLPTAPMLTEIFVDEYVFSELDELETEMMIKEYEQLEMDADSIYYLDSIRNANDSL
ncbi:hypothetical protein [Cytophaga aurantiaca]|uniref:hypothetical protein n=1 Tax=Cytophaga aurantiaca TaxID=29530 RepID=UPI00037E96F6|nr:hypothetical protein [Cytophaga aurantiaca]